VWGKWFDASIEIQTKDGARIWITEAREGAKVTLEQNFNCLKTRCLFEKSGATPISQALSIFTVVCIERAFGSIFTASQTIYQCT